MAVITHPQGVGAGANSPPARSAVGSDEINVDAVIEPSKHCTSDDRLGIYGNAYFARLIDCLAVEFPTVRHFVGDDAFAGFVVSYLQRTPPGSYNLHDLGREFAESLRATRPEKAPEETLPDWADFLIEIARLERLYAEVFDGPGDEGELMLSTEDLQRVPMQRRGEIRLKFARSLRQAKFLFPVHQVISQVRAGEEVTIPEPEETCLIVYRRDYVVRRLAVSPVQYRMIGELRAGRTLPLALGSAICLAEQPETLTPEHVQEWFRDWTAAGLFTGIEWEPEEFAG